VRNPEKGYENYLMVNPKVGKKYFQKFEYTSPANDIFLEKKPENTFRIFMMGSSTVYGFPYERNLMFSRILHQRLESTFPGKKIEMVNTSITAINSFSLLDFAGQILKYEPDAILFYAGHNEFYGAFGVGSNETMSKNKTLTRLHIKLMDLKLYQLVRNSVAGLSKAVAGKNDGEIHGTLMKRMVGNPDIIYGSEKYQIAMERFRQNMDEILTKVNQQKVPVFISELVSNVHDMKPFNSMSENGVESAQTVFESAQKAEKEGDFDRALELYYKAKDLDCIRFRASEDVNRIIDELARKHKAHKIPMLKVFQENSPNKLIGNNLMTEHLHPNIEGNFLMADAFFHEIVDSRILREANLSEIPSKNYQKQNWGYSELDSLLGVHRVELLKGFWPFITDPSKEYNYKNSYRSKSVVDSLAFSKVKNPALAVEDLRLQLAEYYEKRGKPEKAFKEYEALIRMNPYIAVNYRDAANLLLQLGDLPLALKYFEKSLQFEDSFFAKFRIGEIYFLKADYENAVKSFELAFAIAPDDKKVNVLVKTYISFVYSGNNAKADAVASELKRVNAGRYLQVPPKEYVYMRYVPFQTKSEVEAARKLAEEKKFVEAISILESSLNKYISPVAERMIGEFSLEIKNFEKAGNYLRKAEKEFRFDPAFQKTLADYYSAIGDVGNAQKSQKELERLSQGLTQNPAIAVKNNSQKKTNR
jgi:tetratricopeptide (TPR) repeat protein